MLLPRQHLWARHLDDIVGTLNALICNKNVIPTYSLLYTMVGDSAKDIIWDTKTMYFCLLKSLF